MISGAIWTRPSAEIPIWTSNAVLPPKVLTIAGSDSGGAAGLQADLRTFAALGGYGLSVVTVVTAQNSERVTAVHPLPADFVTAQLDAVLTDYGAVAAKTGFIGQRPLIEAIAAGLRQYALPTLVVDPVLVNHKGQAMFTPAVTVAYRQHLLPLATLITPNWREAALLADVTIETLADLETAVTRLHPQTPGHILITGFPDGTHIVDAFSDGQSLHWLRQTRLPTANTHGSGDTLSAAICVFRARGAEMETAVRYGRAFTHQAIQRGATWQLGRGHGPVWALRTQIDARGEMEPI